MANITGEKKDLLMSRRMSSPRVRTVQAIDLNFSFTYWLVITVNYRQSTTHRTAYCFICFKQMKQENALLVNYIILG